MQQVVLKLLFRMRRLRQVDDIMQTQQRTVIFSDLAQFVEKEVIIPTHPVFGNVSGSSKTNIKSVNPRASRLDRQSRTSFALKTEDQTKQKEDSLITQQQEKIVCVEKRNQITCWRIVTS